MEILWTYHQHPYSVLACTVAEQTMVEKVHGRGCNVPPCHLTTKSASIFETLPDRANLSCKRHVGAYQRKLPI
jgi:hypothetical protein